MGRLGGAELGYSSDADVMFVAAPVPGADPHEAIADATAVADLLTRLLSRPSPDPPLEIDAGLRPEGRNGAAGAHGGVLRPVLGTVRRSPGSGRRCCGPGRSPATRSWAPRSSPPPTGSATPRAGWPARDVTEIRRIKARVDAERLPRGADPATHTKLGRGGLADVEWTIQLLQLRHGGAVPGLRTPHTLAAIDAARQAGLDDGGRGCRADRGLDHGDPGPERDHAGHRRAGDQLPATAGCWPGSRGPAGTRPAPTRECSSTTTAAPPGAPGWWSTGSSTATEGRRRVELEGDAAPGWNHVRVPTWIWIVIVVVALLLIALGGRAGARPASAGVADPPAGRRAGADREAGDTRDAGTTAPAKGGYRSGSSISFASGSGTGTLSRPPAAPATVPAGAIDRAEPVPSVTAEPVAVPEAQPAARGRLTTPELANSPNLNRSRPAEPLHRSRSRTRRQPEARRRRRAGTASREPEAAEPQPEPSRHQPEPDPSLSRNPSRRPTVAT